MPPRPFIIARPVIRLSVVGRPQGQAQLGTLTSTRSGVAVQWRASSLPVRAGSMAVRTDHVALRHLGDEPPDTQRVDQQRDLGLLAISMIEVHDIGGKDLPTVHARLGLGLDHHLPQPRSLAVVLRPVDVAAPIVLAPYGLSLLLSIPVHTARLPAGTDTTRHLLDQAGKNFSLTWRSRSSTFSRPIRAMESKIGAPTFEPRTAT